MPFPTPAVTGGRSTTTTSTAGDVDDLFARLRAGAARADARTTNPPTTPDRRRTVARPTRVETPFQRRDAALVPLIVASARKLKRVLADEQNEVLDALRRKEPVARPRRPRPAAIGARRPLRRRHRRRARPPPPGPARPSASPAERVDRRHVRRPLGPVRERSPPTSSTPLRERLERCVADGDGDNDAITKRVRAVYREWKTQHIDDQLDDVFRLAYGRARSPPSSAGTPRVLDGRSARPAVARTPRTTRWPVPSTAGDAYPTGHTLRRRCTPGAAACSLRADRSLAPMRRASDLPRRRVRRQDHRARSSSSASASSSCSSSSSGGRSPGSTSTTCGTTALGRSDVFWGVIRPKFDAVRRVLRDVRRARRAQPVHRRPAGADAVPGQRAPVRRALPRGVRPPPPPRPLRRRRACWR